MQFYVGLFLSVTGLVLGCIAGSAIVVYMIHANEDFIRRRKKKNDEKNRQIRKKRAEKIEIQKGKKAEKKALKDKLINQDFTYADLLDSVEEENTEAQTINAYRKIQDRSYGIIRDKI